MSKKVSPILKTETLTCRILYNVDFLTKNWVRKASVRYLGHEKDELPIELVKLMTIYAQYTVKFESPKRYQIDIIRNKNNDIICFKECKNYLYCKSKIKNGHNVELKMLSAIMKGIQIHLGFSNSLSSHNSLAYENFWASFVGNCSRYAKCDAYYTDKVILFILILFVFVSVL